MRHASERAAVVDAAQQLYSRGLVAGTSGNVSCRLDEGLIAITAHGTAYATMRTEDVIVVDRDGKVVEGERAPSVETAIHTQLLAVRSDFGAVVHSHPVHVSMFALAHRPLPAAIDEFAIGVGADVPVAKYAISGTPDLATNVVEAFGPYGCAALMANHGLVVGAADLEHALELSTAIERTARIVFGAVALGGVVPLPDDARKLYKQVYEYKVKHARGEL